MSGTILFRQNQPCIQGSQEYIDIPLSIFDWVEANVADIAIAGPWPAIVSGLERAFHGLHYREKKDAKLICPTHFAWNERRHEFAKNAGMIWLDSDDLVSCDMMVALLSGIGVAAVIYSSARNRPAHPRIRIVIPLDRLVSPRFYSRVAKAIVRIIKALLPPEATGWEVDPTKLHCGDMFYVPAQFQTAATDDGEVFTPTNEFAVLDGEIWDPAWWIDIANLINPEPEKVKWTPPPPRPDDCNNDPGIDPDSPWSPWSHCAAKISDYLSLSDWRQRGLYGLMTSIANSAHWWRYSLSASELASIAAQIQAQNPPHRPYPYSRLLDHAFQKVSEAAGGPQKRPALPAWRDFPESRDSLEEQLAMVAALHASTAEVADDSVVDAWNALQSEAH